MNHKCRWTSLLGMLLLGGAVVVGMPEQSWPDVAALQRMTARFAPVDIGADLSALPAGERRALAKLVEAGRVMDALFLRQAWGGNERGALRPAGRCVAARPGEAARVPDQQGPVGVARPQRAVHPRRAGEARGRELLPGWRHEGRGRGLADDPVGDRAPAGDRVLHHDPPGPRRPLPHRARTASSTRANWRGRRNCSARRRP